MDTSLLKEIVKVKLDKDNDADLKIFKADQVKVLKDVSRRDEEMDIDIAELKKLED
jgi:hypothetical protein